MGSTINLFSGSSGLNTVTDPTRIPFDPKTGIADLALAVNVSINESRRVNRRTGYTKEQGGNFHSLFCDGGDCLVARDTDLFNVGTDMSLAGIRSGLSGERISYTQVGDRIYYANGSQNGKVRSGISYQWEVTEYVGPETTREFFPAPVGSHIAFAFGRMFIAEDNIVWWSEPYDMGRYDKGRSFWQFNSKVRMIKPVDRGIFISDEKGTWFYHGTNPHALENIVQVASYPAFEWSEAIDLVEGSEIGLQEPGLCALWSSPEGAIAGTPSGRLVNLNRDKIIYPETCRSGAGLLRGYDFIHTIT